MEDLIIKVDGKEYRVKVEETEDGRILVHCNGDVYEVDSKPTKADIFDKLKKKEAKETGPGIVTSPLPGTIYEIKVKKGQKVKEKQPLIKLIAMKMENEITAPKAGTVKEIKVKNKDSVNRGDILIIID
jgi:biotin carboxyl carrier protein|tara:strand:+ start:12826 stop:13212 length:387 start_codon:yes stop_codon:yes gene_type:complete